MEGFVKLKWFEFSQNNSGGGFNEDENQAPTVFIQAVDADQAWDKAENLFDFGYCECCGERWDYPYGDGTDVPMMGYPPVPLDQVEASWYRDYAILHYYDGRKERVDFKPKEKTE